MHCLFQDHAIAGIGTCTVAVPCMTPLELLKVKFQVSTHGPESGIGRDIFCALCNILLARDGAYYIAVRTHMLLGT